MPHTAASSGHLSDPTVRGFTPVLNMGQHEKRGVDCVDCHAGAKKGHRAGLPDRAFCMICHEVLEEHEEKLSEGGPIFDGEGRPLWQIAAVLPQGVVFSHAKHTEAHDCTECHGDVGHGQYVLSDLAARFENCRRCHREEDSLGECTYCHSSLDEGTLPHSHRDGWARTHGRHVRDGVSLNGGLDTVDETCNSCHSSSYCVSCHQAERPRDHTIFFTRAGHGLAADIDRERCAACHTEDRCVRCHLDGATPRPPAHPTGSCHLCHTGFMSHVVMTDNCMFCHR